MEWTPNNNTPHIVERQKNSHNSYQNSRYIHHITLHDLRKVGRIASCAAVSGAAAASRAQEAGNCSDASVSRHHPAELDVHKVRL
jgi:hypothetical protein